MRESRLSGSVRGATRNGRLYRDWESSLSPANTHGFGRSRFQMIGSLPTVNVDQATDSLLTNAHPAIGGAR